MDVHDALKPNVKERRILNVDAYEYKTLENTVIAWKHIKTVSKFTGKHALK